MSTEDHDWNAGYEEDQVRVRQGLGRVPHHRGVHAVVGPVDAGRVDQSDLHPGAAGDPEEEQQARDAKRGLWVLPLKDRVEPWVWRERKRARN